MTEIAGVYVRLRPSLAPDERAALEQLAVMSRSLADGLDSFLANFAPEPPQLEESRD